jgi:hypothetical protein
MNDSVTIQLRGIVIAGLLLTISKTSLAQRVSADPEISDPQVECGAGNARKADDALSALLTKVLKEPNGSEWPELRMIWRQYRACDDGSIAEGFSEASVQLLRKQWSQAQAVLLHDIGLRDFVLRHIDATLRDSDIHAVREYASKRCNSGRTQRALCAEVILACDKALKEQR